MIQKRVGKKKQQIDDEVGKLARQRDRLYKEYDKGEVTLRQLVSSLATIFVKRVTISLRSIKEVDHALKLAKVFLNSKF